ncbi:MAG: hypothetical protein K2H64_12245 [Desulfovibrio sp.]|nr:hypothetical protein [Desulfovibrio sp.]
MDDWEAKFPDLYDYASVREGIAVRQVKGLSRGETLNHASKTPVTHEGVESVEDLYRLAGEVQPGFVKAINEIATDSGGEALFRPGTGLKSPERVQRKIDQDYQEEGAKRVIDALGVTLLYSNKAAVENAIAVVEKRSPRWAGKLSG